MKMKIRVVIPVVCLSVALFLGCQKKEEGTPSAPQTQTQTQKQAVAGPGFSASLPPALAGKTMAPGGKVNVDALNKNNKDAIISVNSEDGFDINGWAFDDKSKSAPESIFIELAPVKGGDKYYETAKRSERGDLAKTFNAPAYKKAGFNLKADIKSVPPGEYSINVIQISDGNPIMAPTGKKINKTN